MGADYMTQVNVCHKELTMKMLRTSWGLSWKNRGTSSTVLVIGNLQV
jgi:hypothetical protein